MSDYEGMTNQDVDPVDVWEEMRDGELRLDAEQEARDLAAEKAQPAEADGLEDEPEACGEGMCQCACDGSHVCGCDCPRCAYCRQIPEYCDCEEDDGW